MSKTSVSRTSPQRQQQLSVHLAIGTVSIHNRHKALPSARKYNIEFCTVGHISSAFDIIVVVASSSSCSSCSAWSLPRHCVPMAKRHRVCWRYCDPGESVEFPSSSWPWRSCGKPSKARVNWVPGINFVYSLPLCVYYVHNAYRYVYIYDYIYIVGWRLQIWINVVNNCKCSVFPSAYIYIYIYTLIYLYICIHTYNIYIYVCIYIDA